MKPTTFFFALLINLLFPFGLAAQQASSFKYFIKYPNTLVNRPEDADYYRILSVDSIAASFIEKYMNGQNRRVGRASNRSPEFEKFSCNGPTVSWYPNGSVARKVDYNKGKLINNDSCFYDNGPLCSVKSYSYTPLDKTFEVRTFYHTLLDRDGNSLIKNGNGIYKETIIDSCFLFSELSVIIESSTSELGRVVNMQKEGEWTGSYKSGRYKEFYKAGDLVRGTAYNANGDSLSYDKVIIIPSYKRDMTSFYREFGRRYRYPFQARQLRVSGRISLGFIVSKDGTLADIKIKADPGYGLAQEAIRVLKSMGDWEPGRFHGLPVRVAFQLPVVVNSNY